MVIDTSVAFKWFVQEEGSEDARKLIGAHPLKAPDCIEAELLNALWFATVQKRFDPRDTAEALSQFGAAVDTMPSGSLAAPAMTMAIEMHHAIYDCLFLAAAEQMSALLVTADKKFHQRVSKSRWAARLAPLHP